MDHSDTLFATLDTIKQVKDRNLGRIALGLAGFIAVAMCGLILTGHL